MSFEDKTQAPGDKALAAGLGPAKALWDELARHVRETYPPVTEAWGFYKAWSLRLVHKTRTILYMLPGEGSFRCAFVFGGKATDAARRTRLPKSVKAAIEEAPVYAEGRGVRLDVRTARDVEAMKTLAAIKMAN